MPPAARPGVLPEAIRPLPPPKPASAPVVLPQSESRTTPPTGAAAIRFVLRQVDVVGGTAYAAGTLDTLWAEMLGREVTLADIYALADRITARYRNDGYLLSQALIPPQAIRNGRVTIRVVEGFVDTVDVRDDHPAGDDLPRRIAERLSGLRPLTQAALERALLLMNDLAGVHATGTLSASPRTPGAADLTVTVTHSRFEGNASLDNRGTRYLGPVQYSAGVTELSALGHYERIGVRVLGAVPFDELHYLDLTGEVPLNADGLRLQLEALLGEDAPGSTLAALHVRDTNAVGGIGIDYPFVRTRARTLRGGLRLDIEEAASKSDLTPAALHDRLRVLRASLTLDQTDVITGPAASNLVRLEASQGLDALGATGPGPDRLRAAGRAAFTKATLYATRLQPVAGPVFLQLSVSAQVSSTALPPAEQFSIGGRYFGRAYDPSEVLGDDGVAGAAELQYRADGDGRFLKTWQAFAYADAGVARLLGTLAAGETRSESASSAGLGLRAAFAAGLSASAEMDVPLGRAVRAAGNRDPRFFFALTGQF